MKQNKKVLDWKKKKTLNTKMCFWNSTTANVRKEKEKEHSSEGLIEFISTMVYNLLCILNACVSE